MKEQPRLDIKLSASQQKRVVEFWKQHGEWDGAMFAQPKLNLETIRFAILTPECADAVVATVKKHKCWKEQTI